jgi:hypothetical protein
LIGVIIGACRGGGDKNTVHHTTVVHETVVEEEEVIEEVIP